MTKNDYNNELYHHGVLGMKWGVIRSRYRTNRDRKRELKKNLAFAKTGNKISSKNRDVLSRKTYKKDDPLVRKKRIDADIKEADDRIKFYGSKRAAKVAIKDEARYAKSVNRGKAVTNTLLYGGPGALAGGTLGALAATSLTNGWLDVAAAGAATGAAVPLLGVGLVSAAVARKANKYIDQHAKDQVLYTDDSEYGHDIVVALKKHD